MVVWDESNVAWLTAVVTVAFQLFFFTIAATFRFDKVTDLAGGLNFAILALLIFFINHSFFGRQIVVTIFVVMWALRLAGFLFYRILKMGRDERFDDKRDNLLRFFLFWVFQMAWVWVVSLPVTILNSYDSDPSWGAEDIVGIVLFVTGFAIEVAADIQKYKFKSEQANQGRFCDRGLWRYSRHPNYFGEILLWWGIYSMCTGGYPDSGNDNWQDATIAGPLFLTLLLLFVSGVPILEKSNEKKYGKSPAYQQYKKETSILLPLPNALYRKLPRVVKQWLLLDFPFYSNDVKEGLLDNETQHTGSQYTGNPRNEA